MLVVLPLMLPAASPALLLERDLFTPGDGLVTLDTTSELEWLDLSVTLGISFQQVSEGSGGWIAAGWRYATGPEVCALFTGSVFALPSCPNGLVHFDHAPTEVAEFIALLSSAPDAFLPPFVGIMGYFEDASGSDPDAVGGAFVGDAAMALELFGEAREMALVAEDNWSVSSSDAGIGSYLVRAVPEPAPAGMVGTGLALLGCYARRRRRSAPGQPVGRPSVSGRA